jgi:hypothetical protein
MHWNRSSQALRGRVYHIDSVVYRGSFAENAGLITAWCVGRKPRDSPTACPSQRILVAEFMPFVVGALPSFTVYKMHNQIEPISGRNLTIKKCGTFLQFINARDDS